MADLVFLYVAYFVVGAGVLAFGLSLNLDQRRLRRELEVLEETVVDEGAGGPPKTHASMVNLALVALVAVMLVAVLLLGAMTGGTMEVSQVLDDPEEHTGEQVTVRGMVRDWNTTSNNFTLVQPNDEELRIRIVTPSSLPEDFEEDMIVRVEGTLTASGDRYSIAPRSVEIAPLTNLFLVFSILWVGMLFYMLWLHIDQRRLKKEIGTLKEVLDAQRE